MGKFSSFSKDKFIQVQGIPWPVLHAEKPLRVLLGCERWGGVRDAFIWAGHDAWSADIGTSHTGGPHLKGDIRAVLHMDWDIAIFFPPCTYMAAAGRRWLFEPGGRERMFKMREATSFFNLLLEAPIPKVAVENPLPGPEAARLIARKSNQMIHPWWFGDPYTKGTCLWLRGLQPLTLMGPVLPWRGSGNDQFKRVRARKSLRGRTYPGVALAMALQWGGVVR